MRVLSKSLHLINPDLNVLNTGCGGGVGLRGPNYSICSSRHVISHRTGFCGIDTRRERKGKPHAHPQVHPSNSNRDVVAQCLITRSGVYFACRCTPARIGSKMERKRGGADAKRGTCEQWAFMFANIGIMTNTTEYNMSYTFGH